MGEEFSYPHVDIGNELAAFSLSNIPHRPHYPTIDPTILIPIARSTGNSTQKLETPPSRHLVTEIMFLACVVAGKWADQRNIPMPYLGTRALYEGSQIDLAALRERVKSMHSNDVATNRALAVAIRNSYGVSAMGSHPIEHRPLGFTHYVKVTSPIRRIFDLIAGWQIDAALREEARLGTSLADPSTRPDDKAAAAFLPFARPNMDRQIKEIRTRQTLAMRFTKSHSQHWVTLGIARAFYLGEAELPHPLTASITKTDPWKRSALLHQIPQMCQMKLEYEKGEDGNEVKTGDTWEIEIDEVKVAFRTLRVKPVRLVARSSSSIYPESSGTGPTQQSAGESSKAPLHSVA